MFRQDERSVFTPLDKNIEAIWSQTSAERLFTAAGDRLSVNKQKDMKWLTGAFGFRGSWAQDPVW